MKTLAAKLRAYFEANPDEWLTVKDIAAKFDVTESKARSTAKYLRDECNQLSSMHVYGLKRAVEGSKQS